MPMTPTATLEFPPNDDFILTIGHRPERRAYVSALAMIDDHANSWDEARSGEALRHHDLLQHKPFLDAATASGALSESLFQAAELSSYLKFRGIGELSVNLISTTSHLQISIRERILDLFSSIVATPAAYSRESLKVTAENRDIQRMWASNFPATAITAALGLDEMRVELALAAEPALSVFDSDVPRFDPENRRVFGYTNSRGVTYFLRQTAVTLRGGEPQLIYFFAKTPSGGKGVPAPLPKDRVVKENPRNGFLTVSKRGRGMGFSPEP
jgi:hypothetical protein